MAFQYEKCMVEVTAIFSSVLGIFSNSVQISHISYFNVWLQNQISSLFGMNFDVTQRKFSERALACRFAGRPVKSVGPYISARFS